LKGEKGKDRKKNGGRRESAFQRAVESPVHDDLDNAYGELVRKKQ